jgi:hypothetical protein
MDFMRAGGSGMWVILFVAVGSAAIAAARDPRERPLVLLTGCAATLIAGMGCLAAGLLALSANHSRVPDAAEALGVGLRELANNGVLAAPLACILGMAAYAARRKAGGSL